MKTWNIIEEFVEIKRVTCIFLLFLIISSCSVPKDVAYFQGLKNLQEVANGIKIRTIYKPQDIISIVISASDPETVIPFNIVDSSISTDSGLLNNNKASSKTAMYLIDSNGMIAFPVIGELKIAGLSGDEVKKMIKEKLKTYIKDPLVSVQLENFKVTILGEVSNPGSFAIENERITLVEALGLAGDLSIQGMRTNITVIREGNNKQTIYKVDLTSKDVFNSPVFYLAQNDIVYVEPNSVKKKESRSSNWPRVLTSVSSVLGIIISVIVLTR